MLSIGLDIGSTTIKSAVTDENGKLLYNSYERHYSEVQDKAIKLVEKIREKFALGEDTEVNICISGSAEWGLPTT